MKNKLFWIATFIVFLLIYAATSSGKTPFDYFTRLSDSFLQGKIYLTEKPAWLTELIPAGPDKFWVVYPPMPAILAMPFRMIFKENFQQQYLAHLLGAGIVVLTMLMAWTVKRDGPLLERKKLMIWSGILAGLGNIIWFLSSVGSSWYLGQVSAAFFLSFALFESLTKKRSFIVGLLLGAAFLSRIHTIISFPVFLYLLKDKKWFKNYILFGIGTLPFIIFDFVYNYLRFGVIWDKAYFILPGILNELDKPWFIRGVANIAYIPNNLIAIFWTFPKILTIPPYIEPSWYSLAIWITTPVFVFAFFAPFKENLVKFLWLAVISIFLIVASHGGTGWAQFGYRFAVDFYPFLFLLVIKAVAKTGLKPIHWILLALSVIVNLWGVIWINFFGWVSF